VLRIAATDILRKDNTENVLACIAQAGRPLHRYRRSPSPVNGGGLSGPHPRSGGEPCEACWRGRVRIDF
jgi:hypothetical protein